MEDNLETANPTENKALCMEGRTRNSGHKIQLGRAMNHTERNVRSMWTQQGNGLSPVVGL